MKKVAEVNVKEDVQADAFAFGSPTYFSILSGPLLTLLTEFYFNKDKLAGKPIVAFSTAGGGQAQGVESIESIVKAFNPKLIQPGLATKGAPATIDRQQAKALGEKLAKAAA